MDSKLLCKSLEIYSKIYQSLWDPPMLYNPTNHRITFLKHPRQYRVWTNLIRATTIFFYTFLCCGFICRSKNQKAIPSFVLIPSCLGCGVCFIVFLGSLFATHSTTATYILNQASTLEENFAKLQKKKKAKMETDYFGAAIIFTVAVSGVIPIFYSVTESLTTYFIYNAFMLKTKFAMLPLLILLFRKLVLFIMVFEFCRIVFGILLCTILCVKVGHFMLYECCKQRKTAMRKSNILIFGDYFNS